jgi:predicted transcriptional regulator
LLKLPCESSVKYVLPALRAIIARRLIEEYGFTQSTVAKALGTTQAAISHYVNVKRGGKWVEKLLSIEEARKTIDEIVECMVSQGRPLDWKAVCRICRAARAYSGSQAASYIE